jgi:hypothetical protein
MGNDAQTVLDAERPREDRDYSWGSKEPEPEGGQEWGDEMDNAVREPCLESQNLRLIGKVEGPTKTPSTAQRVCVPA